MKRFSLWIAAALAVFIMTGPAAAFGRQAFKVPFKFKAAGKGLPAGEYLVKSGGEGLLILTHAASGKEITVPYTGRPSAPAEHDAAGPRLVFDEVGDFVPSYTEYVTVYVLSEVWLSDKDGYTVHVTKGAHKTRTVTPKAPAVP